MRVFRILLFFLLTGCGPQSLEDFKQEGQDILLSLVNELESIHTRDELLKAAPKLKDLFNKFVKITISAARLREKHHLDYLEFTKQDHELSEKLRMELNRLYQLEGGRDIIEKAQEEALHRLDAFEKKKMTSSTSSTPSTMSTSLA